MLENDATFAFRAPKFLKVLCKASGFNYGDVCRTALLNALTDRIEETGKVRKIKDEIWEQIQFQMDFSKRQEYVLFDIVKELREKGISDVVQCTTDLGNFDNRVVQCTTTPLGFRQDVVQSTTPSFDLGIIRELCHVLLTEQEILNCYTILDKGDECTDLLTEYWMQIRQRANENHKDHIVRAVNLPIQDTIRYIDSINLPCPIQELISSVLLDMGGDIADRECEPEEEEG